jgi:hypothetical protein
MPRQSSPYNLLYTTSNNTTGLVVPGSGFIDAALLATTTKTDLPNTPYIKMGDDSPNSGVSSKARGLRLMFFGVGVDGATIGYDVYLVKKIVVPVKPVAYNITNPSFYVLTKFCTGEVSINAAVTFGALFTSSNVYFADVINLTLTAYGTTIEATSDSPGSVVYSPASDGLTTSPAELFIPDVYGADGIIVDLYGGSGTPATEFNALYSIVDG